MNNDDLIRKIHAKIDEISLEIKDAEDELKESAFMVQENYKELRWDGRRIMCGDKPLIECKFDVRMEHYKDVSALVSATLNHAAKCLGVLI
jgi:hypothetical protein